MDLHAEIMNIPARAVAADEYDHKLQAYKCGHRDARHDAAELALKAQARIEELEEDLKTYEKNAWEHFYIHQEVFNYLLSKGYISDMEMVDGDNWEAAAQTIINGIKCVEAEK